MNKKNNSIMDIKSMKPDDTTGSRSIPRKRTSIPIPLEQIAFHYSSLTDYIDAALDYDREGMNMVDSIIQSLHLGVVGVIEQEHYGTILPVIDRNGVCVGGSVQFVDVHDGHIIRQDSLTEYLDKQREYHINPDVLFGENLLSGRQVAIVREERTAILGMMAEKSIDWLAVGHGRALTKAMADRLRGRRIVMFPDETDYGHWQALSDFRFIISDTFIRNDIDTYLIERIKRNIHSFP